MNEDWKPRWNPAAPLEALPLDPQEGFILSRLDGQTRVADLPALTGLPPERVARALERLVSLGAVSAPVAPPAAHAPPPPVPAQEAEEGEEEVEGGDAGEPEASDQGGTHRALYEAQLHPLPADERAALAGAAVEPQLTALCYDPLPSVIKALLQNASFGLPHARLVAQQHRHPLGLEALASRAALLQDAGVRRWLLRNPQLPPSLFNRLFGNKPLRELYLTAASRELPETTRRVAREALRRRFATADAEERVALLFQTEGRVLPMLVSIPVDGRTAAQLCGRTYSSTLLVQNLARWSAAPPPLIAHLMKQELVRRSPSLRTLLARHPNAPRT
jgi:hypothetical protein